MGNYLRKEMLVGFKLRVIEKNYRSLTVWLLFIPHSSKFDPQKYTLLAVSQNHFNLNGTCNPSTVQRWHWFIPFILIKTQVSPIQTRLVHWSFTSGIFLSLISDKDPSKKIRTQVSYVCGRVGKYQPKKRRD